MLARTMEGAGIAARTEYSPRERLTGWADRRPGLAAAALLLAIVLVLVASKGLHDVAQASLNGLSLGSIYALGAVGLTLVYGILKLVNFAHGDFLTFGAYMAFLVNVTWGLPLGPAIVFAMVATAIMALVFERVLWRPMRIRGAGLLQLLLTSIGLAFVIRAVVQYIWGTQIRDLEVDDTSSAVFLDLRIGETELVVIVIGFAVLAAVGFFLRYALIGKQMRAIADDIDLAETSGIDTQRIIYLTWVFSGALAGLAGVLSAATTNVKPELGFELLLPIFAAVVLGGIGDAFGALAAGLVLGVVIEWSTLFIEDRWKLAIGFIVLVVVLVIRPQGVFGKAKSI
jgi:neutral amino acid transport system permease protein